MLDVAKEKFLGGVWGVSTDPPALLYHSENMCYGCMRKRMDRKAFKYLKDLEELRDDLIEALRDSENSEWHHAAARTPEAEVYRRLKTWISYLEDRISVLQEAEKD